MKYALPKIEVDFDNEIFLNQLRTFNDNAARKLVALKLYYYRVSNPRFKSIDFYVVLNAVQEDEVT